MPTLSRNVESMEIKLGASKIIQCNKNDPRLFLQTTLSLSQTPRATTNQDHLTFDALFLIDSGATHNVLCELLSKEVGLLPYAKPTSRVVTGFDGSTCHSSYKTALYIMNTHQPTPFIITNLKDSYDGILGIP